MTHTAADAEMIGVIDADYVVQPDWLKDLVPQFRDPTVGLVQAPQDHRDGERSVMHHAMNGEYAGFFDIGMVQRNELNAIIVHGTMCLIRRAALEAAGGWSSDTICEDTDLGLTLLEHGWQAHYTNRRYGHGLLPDSFEAYKKQRHRWAYGGFQIFKKHWRRFLPGASRLTRDQKREFALGWLNWLGAESLGVVVAILNIVWVPAVAFLDIAVPDRILTIPIIAALHRIDCAFRHALPAARARRQRADARLRARRHVGAMDGGARGRRSAWSRITCPSCAPSKGGPRCRTDFHAFWEAVLAGLLHRRRGRADRHQLQGSARDQYFRGGAAGAEPALHRSGGAGCDRAHPAQRFRHLAGVRSAGCPLAAETRAHNDQGRGAGRKRPELVP